MSVRVQAVLSALVCFSVLTIAWPVRADGVFVPEYRDDPGFGFQDSTPVDPVAGNPESTLGGQRRVALEAAFDIMASHIDSELPIRIAATFEDFGCEDESGSGVVARGGVFYSRANFAAAPVADVYYPGSLASHLSGSYRSGTWIEGRIMINVRTEETGCFESLPDGFWYGIGSAPPAGLQAKPFVPLVLHELGHALGIVSLYDIETGELDAEWPDIYSKHVYSPVNEAAFPDLSRIQRNVNGRFGHELSWLGSEGNDWAAEVTLPPGEVRVSPPVDDRERFPALVHGARPFPPRSGLSGRLMVAVNAVELGGIDGVVDEPRDSADACETLSNAQEVAGAIVLARRGGCYFRTKVANAQAAGAIALVVVDSYAEDEPRALGRNQGITVVDGMEIALWSLARDDGEALLADPPDRVVLAYDESHPAVGTIDGLVRLETDRELAESNVSHVSLRSFPAPFMAAATGMRHALYGGAVDMIPGMLQDLGWQSAAAKAGQWSGSWYDPDRSGEGCQLTLEGDHLTWVLTCYLYRDGEQLWLIGSGEKRAARIVFADVSITTGAGYGPEFDPQDVEVMHWGTIALELYGCNAAFFQFLPASDDFRPMRRRMTKISDGDCQLPASEHPDRSLSGNFRDPARSGEGIQVTVEADGETIVLAWYTYHEGAQMWVIGNGYHETAADRLMFEELYMTRGAGYGPDFEAADVEVIPFGAAVLELQDCNELEMTVTPVIEGFPPTAYSMSRIVPREACRD